MTSATGRRLDYRRLNRIPLGNGNVFTRKVEHENPNTAFHLHVDRSGSMNGSAPNGQRLIDVALDAGMALAAALETIEGVNPGVTAFPGSSSDAAILQRHGERLAKAAGRFTLQPSGGTPMAEGMWFAALQLVQCDEPRKVLGVVTDGSPDNPEKVKDIIARCEAAGIFTFGIGIGCSAVKSLFEEAVVINDVRDLRTALFGIAKKCLMP
jgi:cobalamin biosynthesis protein CobT